MDQFSTNFGIDSATMEEKTSELNSDTLSFFLFLFLCHLSFRPPSRTMCEAIGAGLSGRLEEGMDLNHGFRRVAF